jgi:FolB domain-containing protein
MTMYSSITLNNLELSVNLGWPQGERIKPQIVALDVTLHFLSLPSACMSDQLTDTYCYDQLIKTIKNSLSARNFRLLEHLAHEIYYIIKQALAPDIKVNIRLTKKPAILNLTGGVTFCCGDAMH